MRFELLVGLATISGVAVASPVIDCPSCSRVSSIVRLAHAASPASQFCSSLLHLTTATRTVTITAIPTVTTTGTTTSTADASTVSATATESTTQTNTVTVTASPTTVTVTTSITTTSQVTCFNAATTLSPQVVQPPPTKKRRALEERSVPTPVCFKGWASKALTSACKCLSLKTSTTTVTATQTGAPATATTIATVTTVPTTTVTGTTLTVPVPTVVTTTVTPPPVTTTATVHVAVVTPVANGMQYYVYYNTYDYNPPGPGVDPSLFQNDGYNALGSVTDLNTVQTSQDGSGRCFLPNGPVDCSQVAIVFQGYFFAATEGAYTFTTNDLIDNELMLWHGDIAYGQQRWTKANLDYDALRVGSGPYQSKSVTLNFKAGEVVPMTAIFGNSSKGGRLYFYITTPDGVSHESTNGFFVPGCDASPFRP